ncbi:MAG: efflux RND transporter periplasmic adaptor subunit [Acidobacteria bacterium]|nr:efflux RND transporter periplasmic adaptor subunit [Acidobacteriota bacterium]NIM63722.1 efflux RND transporter periplasmic adaptor subunit [Acidobacteriota bacterium]NIO60107.1 efflux RND transporter periplasmic adaptor subunit [Acidobacteriota bacterium]NIQ31178.1 efflux RND transporter periplasmic adaptor subunit [Acidobacteriota bacterium]NIQ86307.1 efflux RND transporter periplasmic adaptor subunit [Acidobacteriota bacterium]
MNIKQAFSLILIVALLVFGSFLLGCSGADGATEAENDSKDSIEAAPATNENEADDKDKKKKDRNKGKDGDKDGKKEEAVPVEVSELALGQIESVLAFSANLEAESEVSVVAEAQRQVVELLVEEGDRARRGQVLLRLQNDEQTSALAKVKSQVAKAEREFVRQERLYKQELISEEEFNNKSYELEQLRIELADAERELGYTEVRAPISGTVTARMVNLGDQVQIGQDLFDMIDFDSIVARIYIPEKHLTELRTGLPAHVSAQAAPGLDYACTVKRIAPIVDAKSGTVKVTVAVGAKPGLRPGMYVDVNLITTTHNEAVLVPKRAVVYDNDQMYVYRLKDKNRVERVFFEPLLTDKYNIEPTSGLVAGDRVVIAGQAGLKEGALVKIPGEEGTTTVEPEATEETAEVVARASL